MHVTRGAGRFQDFKRGGLNKGEVKPCNTEITNTGWKDKCPGLLGRSNFPLN